MRYKYKTKNTCSSEINFDLDAGIVTNVNFKGGCNGNLKAIPLLIDGWKAEDVIEKLRGVRCGMRPTSCADQLATALMAASKNAD